MATKKQRMYSRIHDHGENIKNIFSLPEDTDSIALCKKLFRIENALHREAENVCNGFITYQEYGKIAEKAYDKLDNILEHRRKTIPVLIDADPRGYILKIPDTYIHYYNVKVHRDMGGNGIIAPDFRE